MPVVDSTAVPQVLRAFLCLAHMHSFREDFPKFFRYTAMANDVAASLDRQVYLPKIVGRGGGGSDGAQNSKDICRLLQEHQASWAALVVFSHATLLSTPSFLPSPPRCVRSYCAARCFFKEEHLLSKHACRSRPTPVLILILSFICSMLAVDVSIGALFVRCRERTRRPGSCEKPATVVLRLRYVGPGGRSESFATNACVFWSCCCVEGVGSAVALL